MQLLSVLNTDLAKLEATGLVFSNLQVACRKSSRPSSVRHLSCCSRKVCQTATLANDQLIGVAFPQE